jgi:hypothetical protein
LEDPERVLKILHWSGTVAAHYTPHRAFAECGNFARFDKSAFNLYSLT